MELIFYIFGVIAVISTFLVVFNTNPMHAILYLVISILSLSVIFFILGAIFSGVIEVIIYAGAIMVLFVFIIMMLNLGDKTERMEEYWLKSSLWVAPIVISLFFLIMITYIVSFFGNKFIRLNQYISIKQLGISLFGTYMSLFEVISLLLLSALVVTFYFGRKK
ncbi:MAG: NADH-quinone oxidoreductase subunit J [Buchnera aphidicola (Eriosoma harunire)]